ncbi:MAG: Hpt domain-containing protein [Pseudomonadota bacterium]
MSPADPIDVAVSDPDVRALLPRYLQRRSEDVAHLLALLDQGQYDAIAQLGHRLRGSGAAYELPAISAIGADLDEAGRCADAASIRDAIANLTAFIQRVRIV